MLIFATALDHIAVKSALNALTAFSASSQSTALRRRDPLGREAATRSTTVSGSGAPQGANEEKDLESAGREVREIAARPDPRLRQWRRRTMGRHHVRANVDISRASGKSHHWPPSEWDNGWYIGLGRPGRLQVRRDGRWRGQWQWQWQWQRSTRNEWSYVGIRAFGKAFLPCRTLRRLPLAASVGHQGQRGRALLI